MIAFKGSQLHLWIGLVFNSMKAIAFIGVVNQFPALEGLLDLLLPREIKRVGEEHFELSAQKLDRRLEANISRPDFVSALLQNGLSEKKGQYHDSERIMTKAEVRSNSFMWVVFLLFPLHSILLRPQLFIRKSLKYPLTLPASSLPAAKHPQP